MGHGHKLRVPSIRGTAPARLADSLFWLAMGLWFILWLVQKI